MGGLTGCYTLNSGEYNDTVDAGYYQTASLGDYVWLDTNGNGIQDDGDTGINGVTVNLYDCAGNPLASTTTADDGEWAITPSPSKRLTHFGKRSRLPRSST